MRRARPPAIRRAREDVLAPLDPLLSPLLAAPLLLAVGWLLGMEQFLWLVLLPLALVVAILRQPSRLVVSRTARLFAAFLAAYLLSGLAAVEGHRWLTFARNFAAFALGAVLLVLLQNRVRSEGQLRVVARAIVLTVSLANLVALAGILNLWRPDFDAPLARLLPAWITATDYGGQILRRTIGRIGWFEGLGAYFRPTSLFLYPTHYTAAIAVALPIAVHLVRHERPRFRPAALVALALMWTCLLLSTSRTALLATLLGMGYYGFFHSAWRRVYAGLAFGVALLILAGSPAWLQDSPAEGARETLETVLRARGRGSLEQRRATYAASLTDWRQRPLLGWGTQRDLPGVAFPAGTHSLYIALLYRHGLVGSILFALVLAALWRETAPARGSPGQTATADLVRLGRWSVVAFLVDGLATVYILDTTTVLVAWSCFGLLAAARRQLQPAEPAAGA